MLCGCSTEAVSEALDQVERENRKQVDLQSSCDGLVALLEHLDLSQVLALNTYTCLLALSTYTCLLALSCCEDDWWCAGPLLVGFSQSGQLRMSAQRRGTTPSAMHEHTTSHARAHNA